MSESNQPIIGILSEVDENRLTSVQRHYAHAIEALGGVPVLLPYVEREETLRAFAALCDGFVFTGGADVEPSRYGEEKRAVCGETQPYRDEQELKFFREIYGLQKPILAICRGMQLINVALDGTLYQDLTECEQTRLTHKQTQPMYETTHEITVCENAPLYRLIGESRMRINSLHHQAIRRLGTGLSVMATSEDGIVEAVYAPAHLYLRGYQWHPERLWDGHEENKRIFEDFITACKLKK